MPCDNYYKDQKTNNPQFGNNQKVNIMDGMDFPGGKARINALKLFDILIKADADKRIFPNDYLRIIVFPNALGNRHLFQTVFGGKS